MSLQDDKWLNLSQQLVFIPGYGSLTLWNLPQALTLCCTHNVLPCIHFFLITFTSLKWFSCCDIMLRHKFSFIGYDTTIATKQYSPSRLFLCNEHLILHSWSFSFFALWFDYSIIPTSWFICISRSQLILGSCMYAKFQVDLCRNLHDFINQDIFYRTDVFNFVHMQHFSMKSTQIFINEAPVLCTIYSSMLYKFNFFTVFLH